MKHLVLGGMRSGKSRWAQQQAMRSMKEVIFIATAQVSDDPEMQSRIARHRAERPSHWQTIEAPIYLAAVLEAQQKSQNYLIVDCLTLWLTNLLLSKDKVLQEQQKLLLNVLANTHNEVILVSNEVGLGVIPMNALARRFVDEAGWLNQKVAEICDEVWMMTAGLPLQLK